MIATRFRSVGMAAAVAGAALACYLVSLKVASERNELLHVERQILAAKGDIRYLQTEIGTRSRLTQLERWNSDVLALSAPGPRQYLKGEVQLAAFRAGGLPGVTRGDGQPAVPPGVNTATPNVVAVTYSQAPAAAKPVETATRPIAPASPMVAAVLRKPVDAPVAEAKLVKVSAQLPAATTKSRAKGVSGKASAVKAAAGKPAAPKLAAPKLTLAKLDAPKPAAPKLAAPKSLLPKSFMAKPSGKAQPAIVLASAAGTANGPAMFRHAGYSPDPQTALLDDRLLSELARAARHETAAKAPKPKVKTGK